MRGAGAARGLPVVDLCLIDIFHSDTILPPSLPLQLEGVEVQVRQIEVEV